MLIHLKVEFTGLDWIGPLFAKIHWKLDTIMATIDEVLADVQQESTLDDSIITLLQNIKAQLDALLAGNLPPEVQAKVDEIFAQVEANKQKVADAITANTPPAP